MCKPSSTHTYRSHRQAFGRISKSGQQEFCVVIAYVARNTGKVKLSLYRPWRPLGLREVEAPTFLDNRLTDGGKVVSPTRRPLFTPRKIPGTNILDAESTLGP
jgi:hypothetical protein